MRLGLIVAAVSSVLAQATPGLPPEVTSWLQLGTAGLVIVGFLTGRIRRGADYDKVVARNERYQEVFEERVLPTLQKANEALAVSNQLLARLAEERRP